MADNVAVTPGAGATVGTNEDTINSVAVQVQRVTKEGGTATSFGNDTTVTTTAENIAARDTRKEVTVQAHNANTDYVLIGNSASQVIRLAPGGSYTSPRKDAIYYKSVSGTQTIQWEEVYDS